MIPFGVLEGLTLKSSHLTKTKIIQYFLVYITDHRLFLLKSSKIVMEVLLAGVIQVRQYNLPNAKLQKELTVKKKQHKRGCGHIKVQRLKQRK